MIVSFLAMTNGGDDCQRGRAFCWSVVWLLVERRGNGIEPFLCFGFPVLCRPPFLYFGTNQKLYRSGVLDPL